MIRIYCLLFMCFTFTIINAQEKAINAGLNSKKNIDGSYIAYPKNLTVKKCMKWFSNNKDYVLISIDSKEEYLYGFRKKNATKLTFVPKSEHAEYSVVNGMLSSLEKGSVKNMISTLKKHPNIKLNEHIIDKIGREFANNYKKCTDIELHGGVYSHSAGNKVIKSTFYKTPTADELTLNEDMKTFILLCPELKKHNMLKRAALEYIDKAKNGDLMYYFKIFNNYGFRSNQEIKELDDKTYRTANTIAQFKYYIELFPDGLHYDEALQMLNGGLYEKKITQLERIRNSALKIIDDQKGLGLSNDIIVSKEMLSAMWSSLFGASTTKKLYTATPEINNMYTTVQNFKSDFSKSDHKNKIVLADSILSFITIIDGLWAGNIQLASSINILGIWKIQDNWDGYIQDGSSFWGTECVETPKCAEIRIKMENAMKTLDRLLINPRTEHKQILSKAKKRISDNYSHLIVIRDNNALLCKLSHEEQSRRLRAERCAGCSIDFSRHESGKIIMKNGNTYEYEYSNGKWRVPNLLWFDSKYDSYEEMIIRFLEECERLECR